MPLFQYKAVSPSGEVQEGVLEGTSQASVIEHLQTTGLIPIRATEITAAGNAPAPAAPARVRGQKKIDPTDLALLTRELATLLKAGMPLDRSLEILINLSEKPAVAALLHTIRQEVRGGAALSKALDQHRDIFSRFYINMVRAGEVGGALGGVLIRLADYLERAQELKSSVISALIYPSVLLITALGSVFLLLIVVVPQFKQIFDQSGATLSVATQGLLALSLLLRENWPILIATVMLALWLIDRSFQNPVSRIAWDARLLRWPITGGLIARIEMARFARSLATLLQNGVPLLTGLAILKETLGNAVFREAVGNISRDLKEGRGIAKPMLETGVFPKLAVQMIAVGEETGKLDDMLNQVADLYDREVAAAIKRALALLQPVMIIGMATFIALIMYLILEPMLGMMDLPT